ncbi:MAG: SPOR domain-containing protein [Alphaproteobacteria bacterium]
MSKPLLAKKGGAAPVKPGAVRAGQVKAPLRPIENDGDVSLDTAPAEAATDTEASTAAQGAMESAPAASLLPFNLLRKKYRPDESPGLVEDEPDIAPTDLRATPEPKRQAELALRTEPKPATGPELRAPVETKPVPVLKMPALKVPKPKPDVEPRLDAPAISQAPTPNPEWRVGIEAMAPPKRPRRGGWLLPFAALAAAFTALVVGWNMAGPDIDLGFGSAPESVTAGETSGDAIATANVEPPPPIAESPAPVEPEVPASTPLAPAPEPEPTASTAAVEPEVAVPVPLEASMPEPILNPAVDSESPAGSESDTGGTPVEAAASESPPVQAVSETQAVVRTPETAAPETAAPETVDPVSTVTGTTVETADQSEPAPVQAAVDQQAASTQTPAAVEPTSIKPTVDVVRLEASGEAVIAGRAAPNSELIVLDNGEPIGTVQADAFGEWVFVPDVALPTGDHEFGLVVKTVQESVVLPAPSTPSLPPAPEPDQALAAPETAPVTTTDLAPEPDTVLDVEANSVPDVAPVTPEVGVDGAAIQLVPVPMRKPEPVDAGAVPADDQAGLQETPAASTADFVVQLASVKTRAGAEQEWRKLKQRFPEILSNMIPALDEVKLAEFGTMIRVRTGAFDSQRDAANLCAQLAAKSQACLVVKTSGGN